VHSPAASVLLLFHRVDDHLRESLASVLAQDFTAYECVLVDNGTGCAPEALGNIGRDPRLHWVRLDRNLGQAHGLNAGIAACRGDFIMLQDSDDVSMPRRLGLQVAALRANPCLGMVAACAEGIDATGRPLGPEFTLCNGAEQRRFSDYTMPVVNPSLCYRRSAIGGHRFRDELRLAPDYDFFTRMIEEWESLALPEVLLHYRHHGGQMTSLQHTGQRLHAGIARLCAGRRRSGRSEDLCRLLNACHGLEAATETQVCRRLGELSLRERLPVLAAYHARRLLAAERSPRTMATALPLLLRALAASPRKAVLSLRLFLTGPLRTHRLHPVGGNH